MGLRDPDDTGPGFGPQWPRNPFDGVGVELPDPGPVTRDSVFHHLRAANGLIKLLDRSGRIVFANRPCRDTLGRQISNGRYWWDLWPSETHPLVIDALRRAGAGETVTFTAFRLTKGALPSWWDVKVQGLAAENEEVDLLLVTSKDVTPKVGASSVMQRF